MTQTHDDELPEGAAPRANVKDQLVVAAGEHFAKFGYAKTTLADLAKEIGFSKTYVYRFFKSKQEIGEVICSQVLDRIIQTVESEIDTAKSSSDKLRRMLRAVQTLGRELFFKNRRLYDIAEVSYTEAWQSSTRYTERLSELIQDILVLGRKSGEFERKTPLDEATRAIMFVMQPFTDPRVLQYNLDRVPDGFDEVIGLVLRSLAP